MANRITKEELLAKARKPAEDAMKLHPFYRGKMQTVSKCAIRDVNDFAIWYTPGVAAPCRAIADDKEKVYEHTNKWNTVAVVSDGTRVLGLGDIGPEAAMPVIHLPGYQRPGRDNPGSKVASAVLRWHQPGRHRQSQMLLYP